MLSLHRDAPANLYEVKWIPDVHVRYRCFLVLHDEQELSSSEKATPHQLQVPSFHWFPSPPLILGSWTVGPDPRFHSDPF